MKKLLSLILAAALASLWRPVAAVAEQGTPTRPAHPAEAGRIAHKSQIA